MAVVGDNTFVFLCSSTSSNPHALALNANTNFPSPPLYYLRLSPPLPPQTGVLVGIPDPAHGTHQMTKSTSDSLVERAGVLDLLIGCKAAMVRKVVVCAWAGCGSQ